MAVLGETATTGIRLPPILGYHSISPSAAEDPNRLRVHPDRLDQQLATLRRLGLCGVSVTELLRARKRGQGARLVGLTFDDGYADFVQYAVPALARAGMTATSYVVAGRIGEQNLWDDGPRLDVMDATQLRTVVAAGHEVGSHSLRHPRLAEIAQDVLTQEVVESRRVLEDTLGRPVAGFCYPHGSFDGAAVSAVESAGYEHACVTNDYSVSGMFTLPRFYVVQEDHPARLAAKIARHYVHRTRKRDMR